MSSGIVFHLLAALAYAVPGLLLWRTLARGGTVSAGKASHVTLLTALVLQVTALHGSILAGDSLQLNWALALSAATWLGMSMYWLENLVLRADGLQLLLLPLAALTCLLAACFPEAQIVAHAGNPWLRAHLLISLAAYGFITIAALHSILMAIIDRHLHRPLDTAAALPEDTSGRLSIFERLMDSMPPLLVQEQQLFRLIWMGFSMLTLAVGSGSISSMQITGAVLPLDHKTIFTLLSWLTFGGLLLGRHIRGWRGRVALRWTLTGFAFMLLAYSGSRFVIEVILQRG
ncbi:FIG001154: CcsA-related protein [plant metagenome]|uniref:FIG001154: CcsA-related protein n=1 Tax=plant metagenome TaxID=1297885 RepID=A0A484P7D6_9ZZZZ